jgi:hypothetical protein
MAKTTHVLSAEEKLALANRRYREFRSLCFWHSPPNLAITEDLIPFVINGLRNHGGHRGFRLAAELERGSASSESDEESNSCR